MKTNSVKRDFPRFLETVLRKMCEFAEADFESVDFKKENWFWDHTWSQKQENEFKKWLVSYLIENKEARVEIMRWPRKDKAWVEKLANEFIFNYGWKTNEKIND